MNCCCVWLMRKPSLRTSFLTLQRGYQALVTSHCSYPKSFFGRSFSLCRNTCYSPLSKYVQQRYLSKSALSDHLLSSKPAAGSSSGDDGQSSEKKKEDEFRKKAMKYTFIAFGSIFASSLCVMVYEWGSPLVDKDGNIVEDEFSNMPVWKAYILRTYKEMMNYNKMIKDPSREKLLPDPLTEPYYQPPYTLVLEMTGILVHPDWTYRTGWRFKKRPGVDYFLQQVGPPLFEVVIFTSEQGFTAYPILDTLDPSGYIMYRLFRDSTRYMNGHHVKDISCLNRDLSKVIYLDWDSKSFSLQPQNALMIKKWSGNDDDQTLFDLANMLRTIATSEVQDVRPVLEYYSQFDDPVAVFKENQRKLQEEEQKRLQESHGKPSSLVSTLSSSLRGRR